MGAQHSQDIRCVLLNQSRPVFINIDITSSCSFNNMIRNCPVPSAPENGAVNVTGVQPIVAKYSCHEGTLVGPEIRTCLESGWSGEEPSCRTGINIVGFANAHSNIEIIHSNRHVSTMR